MRALRAYFAVVTLYFATHSSAAIIFESGSLGETAISWQSILDGSVSGTSVNPNVFVGARFFIDQKVRTSKIGGHFIGHPLNLTDGFFRAIITLDDELDLPDSYDLSSSDVLGVTYLQFSEPSDEVFGELAVTLKPGWHAIVYGSGLFGTTAVGGALRNGIDNGSQSYIAWQLGESWFELSLLSPTLFTNHHFVVHGTYVPEPTNYASLIAAGFVLTFLRSCRKRMKKTE